MGFIESREAELPLHLDGSWMHRRDEVPPYVLADHLARHIVEAFGYNAAIEDVELRKLADRVAEATEGQVHFVYTDDPCGRKRYYRFAPDLWGRTRDELMAWLTGKLPAEERQ